MAKTRTRAPAKKRSRPPVVRSCVVLPKVCCLDLGKRPGEFVTQAPDALGHRGTPPKIPTAFGAPRYSREMQLQNPDKPMTRVVKDVLPVGSWKVGHDKQGRPLMWNVTRDELLAIADQFALAQSRGVAMNLTKSHGDVDTLIVPTDDLIAPIDQVIVENDTLWVSAYVTPEQAKQLQNPAMKVSPGVTTRFEDGHGNRYPIMLYHTAVIDQPTVTNQGAFLALANKQPEGGTTMDEVILELFRRLFAWAEAPLPETVTPENAMEILPVLIDLLVGSDDGEETEEVDGSADEPLDTAAMTLALQQIVKRLDRIEVGSKKEAFESRVAGLVSAGKIQAKSAVVLNNQAATHGYNLSILDVFDLEPAKVPMGRKSVALANTSAPPVGNQKKVASLEDRVNKLLGNKAKKK